MPPIQTDDDRSINRRPNYSGRKTFDFILGQVADCILDIAPFFVRFDAEAIYTATHLEEIKIYQNERPKIDPIQLAQCDIAYGIVFFGVSHHDLTTFNRIYKNKYNQLFLSYLSFFIKNKPHPDANLTELWDTFLRQNLENILDTLYIGLENQKNNLAVENFYNDLNWFSNVEGLKEIVKKKPFKYYGGHQFKLGHYYRHLFQSVKYIDEQSLLTYEEKYEYLKTLRAQLSTPEQYLLFFNTISSLGRAWELKQLNKISSKNFNCYLVTKYNFIKNIPDTFFIDTVNIKDYYPLVHFEFDEKPDGRTYLEKKFR